jgi:hypothetical protein
VWFTCSQTFQLMISRLATGPLLGLSGEVWSKAVVLALLSIARLQKRDLAVIHFSGPNDLRLDLFPKGEAAPASSSTAVRSRAVDGEGAGIG